jgi:hypothetical protein
MYLGKAALNLFRWSNGYFDQTYNKVWSGEEDNVVLVRLLDSLDMNSPELIDVLFERLQAVYDGLERA